MKLVKYAVGTASLMALAACGGGSNGPSAPPIAAPAPTPSPTAPAPSPSPTPGSTPATNTNLTNLTAEQRLRGQAAGFIFSRSAENQVQFTGLFDTPFNLDVAPAASTYEVTNITGVASSVEANPTIRFSPADVVESDARYTRYRRTIGDFGFTLKLLNPGSRNDLIALTYSSIGYSLQGRAELPAAPTYAKFDQRNFAFGFATPENAALPPGNLRYRGVVLGVSSKLSSTPNTPVYEVTGTLDVTVNFATAAVNGTIILAGKDDRTGAIVDLGTYTVTMVDGQLVVVAPGGGEPGMVTYRTYGPAAEELSGAARLQLSDSAGNRTYFALAFASKR